MCVAVVRVMESSTLVGGVCCCCQGDGEARTSAHGRLGLLKLSHACSFIMLRVHDFYSQWLVHGSTREKLARVCLGSARVWLRRRGVQSSTCSELLVLTRCVRLTADSVQS